MGDLKRQALDAIIRSLNDEPQAWQWRYPDNLCVVDHIGSKVALWYYIGNARLFGPHKVEFGFWDTRRLKRALAQWRSVQGRKQENAAATSACEYVIAILGQPS